MLSREQMVPVICMAQEILAELFGVAYPWESPVPSESMAHREIWELGVIPVSWVLMELWTKEIAVTRVLLAVLATMERPQE